MAEPAPPPGLTNPKQVVAAYLILVFALSSIFWYLIAAKPQFALDSGLLRYSGMLLMWSPAVAAIVTRFAFQKNFAGFGFKIGELRWWLLAVVIPVAVGLVMFGTAWVTGVAPFLPDKAVAMLRTPAGPSCRALPQYRACHGRGDRVEGAAGPRDGQVHHVHLDCHRLRRYLVLLARAAHDRRGIWRRVSVLVCHVLPLHDWRLDTLCVDPAPVRQHLAGRPAPRLLELLHPGVLPPDDRNDQSRERDAWRVRVVRGAHQHWYRASLLVPAVHAAGNAKTRRGIVSIFKKIVPSCSPSNCKYKR